MSHADSIGRYTIERELGRGGMGVVYLAIDPTLDRKVALKVLPQHIGRDPDQLARFEREAKVLASMNHPNIGVIHSLERTDDGAMFVVLEFIEGDTLTERIAKGPPSLEDSVRMCRQIAEALHAAHESGIVHRDLKPSNVMLTRRGWVKVLDFGLASVGGGQAEPGGGGGVDPDLDVTADIRHSHLGVIQGTPGYMSPEQARGEEQDDRTDVFAFGCVLYECLTGKRAFEGDRVADLLDAVQHAEPDWSALPPDTPHDVVTLLSHCLEKRLNRRLSSLKEAAARLDEVMTSGSTTITRKIEHSKVRNNLPTQMSTFVGRGAALNELMRMVADTRLLTLTGSGGCGKTRLAVRLAAEVLESFGDGVWFVDLASLTEPSRVAHSIMSAIGATETRGKSEVEAIVARLGEQSVLLIMDNCEHVIDEAASVVNTVLTSCPNVLVVATSREALGLTGETTYRVPSLSAPPTGDHVTATDIEQSESVALFMARARAVNPAFHLDDWNAPAVAFICAQLDGIPLAVELAAARVKAIPPAKIAERLSDLFAILTGGSRAALPRQRTLRATIEWSYELLEEPERRLLQRLSVFPGGCSLEAAEQVCPDDSALDAEADALVGVAAPDEAVLEGWQILDIVSSLIDKSLVTYAETDGEGRYGLLNTVRRFAADALARDEGAERVLARRLEFFAGMIRQAQSGLLGPEQGEWLRRLQQDQETLLAAVSWAHDRVDPGQAAARARRTIGMAAALGRFWMLRGRSAFGLTVIRKILDGPEGDDRAGRAAALNAAGSMARRAGDFEASRRFLESSLAIREEMGDKRGIATAETNLSLVVVEQGDYAEATTLATRAFEISREINDKRLQGINLGNLGQFAARQGEFERARELYEQAIRINREIGNRAVEASNLNNLSEIEMRLGNRDASADFATQALDVSKEIGDYLVRPSALLILGELARARGDAPGARKHWYECLTLRLNNDDQLGCIEAIEACVTLLLDLAAGADHPDPTTMLMAVRLAGVSTAVRDSIGAPLPPNERDDHAERWGEIERLARIAGVEAEHAPASAWKEVAREALAWLGGG